MKIVILDGISITQKDLWWEELSEMGELEVHDRTEDDEAAESIGDAEIVFTSKCPISREVMDACPQIKFTGSLPFHKSHNPAGGQIHRNHRIRKHRREGCRHSEGLRHEGKHIQP